MANLSRKMPAPISEEMTKKVEKMAITAFNALDCKGVARVDFLLDKASGELYVGEINTIPGSLAFYLWKESGISFPELLDRLVDIALKRAAKRSELTSSFDTNLLSTATLGGSKGVKK